MKGVLGKMETSLLTNEILRFAKEDTVLNFNFEGTAWISDAKGSRSELFPTGAITEVDRVEVARLIIRNADLSGNIVLCGNPKDKSARIRFV